MASPAVGGTPTAGVVSDKLLKGQSLGLILLRCQEILKASERPMTTYELQVALSGQNVSYTPQYYAQLFSDPSFIHVLRSNSQLSFDPRSRKWQYVSPFAALTSWDALLAKVDELPDGLEINQELLEAHPQMSGWVFKLLEERRVRAIRTGKTSRCKTFPQESGDTCDIYQSRSNKCESCAMLKNITLYGKARPEAANPEAEQNDETYRIDDDIKELWAGVALPNMEKILEEIRMQSKMKQLEGKKRRRGRARGPESGVIGRIGRIANAHIYSVEDYRAELTGSNEAM